MCFFLNRAVIDSNENGDLLSASVLSSFRESGQYATFGGQGEEYYFLTKVYVICQLTSSLGCHL